MARLNISMPDDLHKRLEEQRDALNISAICQEALRRELARREPLLEDMEITDEMVQRIRAEKEEYERESRERGFQIGSEWARRAKYTELRRWGERKIESPEALTRLDTPPHKLLDWLWEDGPPGSRAEVDRLVQSHPELQHAEVVGDYLPREGIQIWWFELGDKRSFNEGFLQAVKRFWQLVKERI